jgi:hypothetical protein
MSDIWQNWKDRYQKAGVELGNFWTDGIIDGDAYAKEKTKLLFVLREANAPKDSGDLCDILRRRFPSSMWFALARWAAGFHEGFPPYAEIKRRKNQDLHELLPRVAVMNLKKVGGGAKSDGRVINAFAYIARDLLVRQIQEIRPNIVVACGVFDTLIWLLDLDATPSGVKGYKPARERNSGFWVIPWRHPSRAGAGHYGDLRDRVKGCSELSKLLPSEPTVKMGAPTTDAAPPS